MSNKGGRLVWLDIELVKKRSMLITSPSGASVSLSFDCSKELTVGTNCNTFRVLRVLSGSGNFLKFYGNRARVQFSIPEMAEIKQLSKLNK